MYVADFGSGLVISFGIQSGGTRRWSTAWRAWGRTAPDSRAESWSIPRATLSTYRQRGRRGIGIFGGRGQRAVVLASYATAAITRQTFDLALANNAAALFLYATNGTINTVSDFIVSTGVLSLQSATGGLSSPEGIVSDPSGSFVYAANNATGQVLGYAVGRQER